MYGKDYNYAESRLVDSIVRIAKTNQPIMVQRVDAVTGTVSAIKLSTREDILVELDDLNLKPVPLGWCNTQRGATYLARIPKRRDWRQGIRAETCFSSQTRFVNIQYADLAKCIMGEYPRLDEVLKAGVNRVVAWSRKWATDCKSVFFGNLGEVGTIVDSTPVLNENFLFLKESLALNQTSGG